MQIYILNEYAMNSVKFGWKIGCKNGCKKRHKKKMQNGDKKRAKPMTSYWMPKIMPK